MSTTQMPQLVWLITGGSSGLGLALVHQVLARGDLVITFVRDPSKLFSQLTLPPNVPKDHVHAMKFDLTESFESIKKKVEDAERLWGRIDVLVNNAGRTTLGTLEEGGSTAMIEHFNVNFFGIVNITNAILPHMRKRRSGTIVMMGSRSVFRNQFYGIGYYAAAKAALHSYGESLSAELAPFSIRVLVVIPGSFRTPALEAQYEPVGTPILPDYAPVQKLFETWTPGNRKASGKDSDPGTPQALFTCKGDPERGMGVLVDVVKGEGRVALAKPKQGATEGQEWPLWLFIGEDGMVNARERMGKMMDVMDRWEAVGSDVSFVE